MDRYQTPKFSQFMGYSQKPSYKPNYRQYPSMQNKPRYEQYQPIQNRSRYEQYYPMQNRSRYEQYSPMQNKPRYNPEPESESEPKTYDFSVVCRFGKCLFKDPQGEYTQEEYNKHMNTRTHVEDAVGEFFSIEQLELFEKIFQSIAVKTYFVPGNNVCPMCATGNCTSKSRHETSYSKEEYSEKHFVIHLPKSYNGLKLKPFSLENVQSTLSFLRKIHRNFKVYSNDDLINEAKTYKAEQKESEPEPETEKSNPETKSS